MGTPRKLSLALAAQHIEVDPGGELVLRGSFHSSLDGSVVDAATTSWPTGAPGGAFVDGLLPSRTIDAGGLIDFAAGGFRLTGREAQSHEVRAVATGQGAEACAELGVTPPCLVLRSLPQARSRLVTAAEWARSLHGGIEFEVVGSSSEVSRQMASSLAWSVPTALAAVLALAAWTARRRARASPAGQLLLLARRLNDQVRASDDVAAAALAPAVQRAIRAIRQRRIDPCSAPGQRVRASLLAAVARIDRTAHLARAEQQEQVAGALVLDVESALDAADEVSATR